MRQRARLRGSTVPPSHSGEIATQPYSSIETSPISAPVRRSISNPREPDLECSVRKTTCRSAKRERVRVSAQGRWPCGPESSSAEVPSGWVAYRKHLRRKVGADLIEVDRPLQAEAAQVLDWAREGVAAAKPLGIGHKHLACDELRRTLH